MRLSLTCPSCHHSFRIQCEDEDVEARCPSCRTRFPLPVDESDDELVELKAADAGRVCESCGAAMDAKAILCIECGFNRKTGSRASKKSRRRKPQTVKLTDESYTIRRTLFGNTYWIDADGKPMFELKKSRSWPFGRTYEIEWKDAKTDKPVLTIEKTESGWLKRSFQIELDGEKAGSIRFSRNLLKEPFNMIMKWNDEVVVDMVHHDIDRRGTLGCGQLVYVVLAPFFLIALAKVIAVGLAVLFLLSPLIVLLVVMGVIPVPQCRFRRAEDGEALATLRSRGLMQYELVRTTPDDPDDLLIPMILSVLQLQRDLRVGEVLLNLPTRRK